MTLPEAAVRRASTARSLAAALVGVLGATTVAMLIAASPAAAHPATSHDPTGKLLDITAVKTHRVELTGWAADPDSAANTVVRALVDGSTVAKTTTSIAKPKVAKHHHTGPTPGFDFTAHVPGHGAHTLCVVASNRGAGISRMLGCKVVPLGASLTSEQVAAHSPTGKITAKHATSSTLEYAGWVADPDFRSGRIVTVLYVDGSPAKTVDSRRATADQRADGAGRRGAFDITVPASAGAHIGCLWVVNVGYGSNTLLGCQALDTRGRSGSGTTKIPAINKVVVKKAKKHIGQDYVWGSAGPKTFDCSGLVMFSYHKAGYTTPRISQDQFHAARVIPASHAVRGDLVFYHDNEGSVYHVGIYLKPGLTVAAIDTAEGVDYQQIYAPNATYGSFTHS